VGTSVRRESWLWLNGIGEWRRVLGMISSRNLCRQIWGLESSFHISYRCITRIFLENYYFRLKVKFKFRKIKIPFNIRFEKYYRSREHVNFINATPKLEKKVKIKGSFWGVLCGRVKLLHWSIHFFDLYFSIFYHENAWKIKLKKKREQ
jgi:hypothetical protein